MTNDYRYQIDPDERTSTAAPELDDHGESITRYQGEDETVGVEAVLQAVSER